MTIREEEEEIGRKTKGVEVREKLVSGFLGSPELGGIW